MVINGRSWGFPVNNTSQTNQSIEPWNFTWRLGKTNWDTDCQLDMYKKSHRSKLQRSMADKASLRHVALLSSSGKWVVAALTFIQRPTLLNEPAQDKLSYPIRFYFLETHWGSVFLFYRWFPSSFPKHQPLIPCARNLPPKFLCL